MGLEKKTKDSYPTAGKINRGRNKTGHKIASKERKRKRSEDRKENDGEEGEDGEEKKGKIDGKALAANATLAFSGLVGENFHHRLFLPLPVPRPYQIM